MRPLPMLEVIACTVEDAIEAERGGAGRLEVIRGFEVGGLTPPLDLVRNILAAVSLPVRVMLRESESFTVTDRAGIERLCDAARALSTLGIDGLVLGFIRDGGVDIQLTREVLQCAPDLKATFHRAFDQTRDPLRNIGLLKECRQVDRLLTDGGPGDLEEKAGRLSRYHQEASPQITVLAGGGLNAGSIRHLSRHTAIREYHVGRAARVSRGIDKPVCAAQVRELIQSMVEGGIV